MIYKQNISSLLAFNSKETELNPTAASQVNLYSSNCMSKRLTLFGGRVDLPCVVVDCWLAVSVDPCRDNLGDARGEP